MTHSEYIKAGFADRANRIKMVSQAQINYIAALFDDCGFNPPQKRDWLMTGYSVKYADELTMDQGGAVIRYLLALKETRRGGKLKL